MWGVAVGYQDLFQYILEGSGSYTGTSTDEATVTEVSIGVKAAAHSAGGTMARIRKVHSTSIYLPGKLQSIRGAQMGFHNLSLSSVVGRLVMDSRVEKLMRVVTTEMCMAPRATDII